MTQNALQLWPEIIWVTAGAVVLFIFAVAIGVRSRAKVLPGSRGHREETGEFDVEEIRADGYIDGFAKDIEEAGGGVPLVVKIALVAIPLWWLIYLILNWTQR
jgi:hypothetical protein